MKIRSREEQQPAKADMPLLERVCEHFRDRPYDFEHFAADLWRMSEPNVDKIDVTRPWRDGGRDAVGEYLIGPAADPVAVEFALKAKCYAPGNGVGVRPGRIDRSCRIRAALFVARVRGRP